MNLKQLFELDEKLQPLLKHGYYSFIAPIDMNLFEDFAKKVQEIAPGSLFNKSIHRILSNRDATRKALLFFSGSDCRIYVVDRNKGNGDILLHDTIEGYCEDNGIEIP